MSETSDRIVEMLAEPLCRAICDLLGEPRVLVPAEVTALLTRVGTQGAIDDALAETKTKTVRAAVYEISDVLTSAQQHGQFGRVLDELAQACRDQTADWETTTHPTEQGQRQDAGAEEER